MIARQWENEIAAESEEAPPVPRLREIASPIGQLLGQNMLDEAVRALQEDLAMLQAEQERNLGSLGGALEEIGHELGAVRAQLEALAEPILAIQTPGRADPAAEAERERESAETQARLDRLEKQVVLLLRGLESVDSLRYQSDVHTRALARLTDLLGEVVRPKPVEGLEPLQAAVAALEQGQRRGAHLQVASLVILGLGLTPGLGALAWIVLRAGGV